MLESKPAFGPPHRPPQVDHLLRSALHPQADRQDSRCRRDLPAAESLGIGAHRVRAAALADTQRQQPPAHGPEHARGAAGPRPAHPAAAKQAGRARPAKADQAQLAHRAPARGRGAAGGLGPGAPGAGRRSRASPGMERMGGALPPPSATNPCLAPSCATSSMPPTASCWPCSASVPPLGKPPPATASSAGTAPPASATCPGWSITPAT